MPNMGGDAVGQCHEITPGERPVLALVAQGKSDAEIEAELGLTDAAVRSLSRCHYTPCTVAYLGLGSNYRGGDFDYQNVYNISPSAWTDNVATSRALAGIYPAGGASGAWNNTRDQCKNLTVNGATAC